MTTVLWEREIPPTSYGYWILESGECLPVADMKHAVVAADYLESIGVITDHDMERYELMFKSGSIRVTMSNAVYTGELNVGFQCDLSCTSVSAILSLIQICRTERPDTVTKDFWNAVAGWTLPLSKALLKLNEIKQQLKRAAVLNESDEDDSRRQELEIEFGGIRNFRAIAKSEDTAKHFRLIEWNPHTIYFFNNPTINLQIAAVKHEPWAIDSITDPPPLIQFLAFSELLNKHGDPGIGKTIKLISNLDPSIQLIIVEKRPELFSYIQTPTEEARQLYDHKMSLKESFESDDYWDQEDLAYQQEDLAYQQEDLAYQQEEKWGALDTEFGNITDFSDIDSWDLAKQLRLIEWKESMFSRFLNPSINLQIAAVRKDPFAIDFIKNPVGLIQHLAFSKFCDRTKYANANIEIGSSIEKITNLDPSIQLMIVEERPELFSSIQNPTKEAIALYKQTIKNAPIVESDRKPPAGFEDWNEEQKIEYVKKKSGNIRFITAPSINVQLAAVQSHGIAIRHIHNPSPMIQAAACKKSPSALNWVYPATSIDLSLARKYRAHLNSSTRDYVESKYGVDLYDDYKPKITESDDIFPTQIDPGAWPSTWQEADNCPESEKIEYVKHFPEDLGNFTNPSLVMQLTAVQRSGLAIMQIYNPAPLIQFAAYKQNPDSITWVEPQEARLPELVKQYEEIHGLSNLTEAVIPPTRYGYWIMPDGKYVAVDYTNHEQVAMEILDVTDMTGPACLPQLLRQGAIRVVSNYEHGSLEFEIATESRPALRSLVRLIMSEKPDKIVADWGTSVIQGDWQQVAKRINNYLSNQPLQENQTSVSYGSWILSDGSKIEVGYEQHNAIARERFGCRNYAEMFDQGAIRVVNEHWSREWEKLVETEVAWGMQTPSRKALRTLRNEIRRINPTLKIFFESGDATLNNADGYDGEVFESATKFLRFINQLIEQSVNPNISAAESEQSVSIDVKMQLASVKNDWVSIKSIKDPVVEVQLAAVEKNGYAIQFIKNPVIEVQLAAVKQNAMSMEVIYNPPLSVQHAAIKQKPETINFIDPIEATDISLLQQYRDILNPDRLEYLEKLEKENLQEHANNLYGAWVLEDGTFVPVTDRWGHNEALDKNKYAHSLSTTNGALMKGCIRVVFVPGRLEIEWAKPTQQALTVFYNQVLEPRRSQLSDIVLTRYKSRSEVATIVQPEIRIMDSEKFASWLGKIIRRFDSLQDLTEAAYDVTNPNTWPEERQIKLVQRNPWKIEEISNPSTRVQMASVQSNWRAIQYIKQPSLEVQLYAVQQDEWVIWHIPNPLPMIQAAACSKHPGAINHIYPIESVDLGLMKHYFKYLTSIRQIYFDKIKDTLTESVATEIYQLPKGTYGGWISPTGTFLKVDRMFGHEKIASEMGYNRNYDFLADGAIRLIFGGNITNQLQIEMHQPSKQACRALQNLVREIDFQEIQLEYQANNKRLSKKFNMVNLSDKKKLQELLTTI